MVIEEEGGGGGGEDKGQELLGEDEEEEVLQRPGEDTVGEGGVEAEGGGEEKGYNRTNINQSIIIVCAR